MKRRIFYIAVTVVGVIAVVWLIVALAVPSAASVTEAEQRDIVDTLVATGQVTADHNPTLTADVATSVQSVAVEPGDQVEGGDVIAELDAAEAEQEVARARAGLEEARAMLRSVTERGAPTALEDVDQASRNLEAAREDLERAQQLYDAGVGTRMEVEEAQRAVDRAQSELNRAVTAYEETTEAGSEYDQAAAGVARAEAEHQLAQRRLDDYTLRAPANGTVLTREVDPGDTVQPGAAVATLAADGPRDLRIEPDERELASLQLGQPAIAAPDAYPDEHFRAEVHRIDPAVDPETGTITAYLRIDDPPAILRSAMTVTVDIELARRDDATVVSRRAVREIDGPHPYVLVVDQRRAARRNIEVGIDDARLVEITDGLEPGDVVIADQDVERGDRVRAGELVEMLPDDDRDAPSLEEQPPADPGGQS